MQKNNPKIPNLSHEQKLCHITAAECEITFLMYSLDYDLNVYAFKTEVTNEAISLCKNEDTDPHHRTYLEQ